MTRAEYHREEARKLAMRQGYYETMLKNCYDLASANKAYGEVTECKEWIQYHLNEAKKEELSC